MLPCNLLDDLEVILRQPSNCMTLMVAGHNFDSHEVGCSVDGYCRWCCARLALR
jgi:hypothetical protein